MPLEDLRYAIRFFRKSPSFTLAVLLSLAIGIGANTAMFSVANALLLRPLPYGNADRLVILWNRSPGLDIAEDWFSTAQYFDVKSTQCFEQVALAIGGNESLTGDGDPERVGTIHVSSNLLPMLGVRATAGRLFTADEDVRGGPSTAMLSYPMWKRRFAGDTHVLGKSLAINGKLHQIVGILPEGFSLPREVLPTLGGAEQAEILLPLPLGPEASQARGHEDYNILAKLKPGHSVRQAQAEMDTLTALLRHDYSSVYPPNGRLTFGVVALQEQVVGDIRGTLLLLTGAVGLVLLIACANVANLLLSRAAARQKEIAVRMALGAPGGRVLRQLMTESVLLAFGGGLLGLGFAGGALAGIRILGPKIIPRLPEVGLNVQVLLYAAVISLFSAVLFGLAPGLRLRGVDLNAILKNGGRGSAATGAVWGRANGLRKLLVVSEIALSVILLIGAGLLIRSFVRVQQVRAGFNPDNVLTLELTMTGRRYDAPGAVGEAYRLLDEQLEHLPGVKAAGAVTSLPLSQMFAWGPIVVEGRVPAAGENFLNADQRVVAGHYFEAMSIPLLAGRFFSEHDSATNPRVALIDDYMAQELWPGQNPVGRRFRFADVDAGQNWVTVVGVVGRVKQYTLDSDSRMALYVSHIQFPSRDMNVVLRAGEADAGLAASVREVVRNIDRDLPIFHLETMEQRVRESLGRRRFSMVLLGLFAGFALLLATIGIYGVVSYLVTQGTRDMGIRLALGASETRILTLVMRQGLLLALGGITAGLTGGLVLARIMRGMLFGISAGDPTTYIAVCGSLGLLALVASYIPARRAARVDPTVSLRWE
jgi:predicted permease